MPAHTAPRKPITAYQASSYIAAFIGMALLADGLIQLLTSSFIYTWPVRLVAVLGAGLAVAAAVGYRREQAWSLGCQASCTAACIILLIFSTNDQFIRIHQVLTIASFAVLVAMLLKFRVAVVWVIVTLAVFLTGCSFLLQRMGPSIGVYGTECPDQPGGLCMGHLLGAGFPIQYMLDQPGVSIVGEISFGDQLMLHLFLADVAIYFFVLYLVWWAARSLRSRRAAPPK